MNCGIYAITTPSGRLYIGSSNRVNIRWRNHRHQLRKQIHHCVALQRAANVYGVDRLVFSVVELCCEADLLVREQAYIDGYGRKKLYNSTLQAGGMRGFVTSTETRAKMSAASLGKPKSAEAKANMSAYARQRSPEHLAKLAAAFTGKKASDVTRAKQSAAKRGKKRSPSISQRCKPLDCLGRRKVTKPAYVAYSSIGTDGAHASALVACIST